jgi:putative oxidoreductase
MTSYPFLTQHQSMVLLRCSLALIFISHAVVRVIYGTIPIFGGFLETKGIPAGVVIVWMITIFEIVGGIAMGLGYLVKWISAGFIVMLLVGIILIHFKLGWFVGEHGTGGSEYSFILIIGLIVVAAGRRTVVKD